MPRVPLPRLACFLCLCAGLGGGPLLARPAARAAAEEAGGAGLSLKRLFDGAPYTRALPEWSWRPGRPERVRLAAPGKGRGGASLLVAPAADGPERVLLDLDALAQGAPARGAGARGIGRAPAPRFVFDPGGEALLAVVGGAIVWADPEARAHRLLLTPVTPVQDLKFSPDARHVSFVQEHDLWVVPSAGGPPRRLTRDGSEARRNASLDWLYPEELGHDTGHWWAPGATRIAFLQLDQTPVPNYRVPAAGDLRGEGPTLRYPRAGEANPVARVGVVDVAGGPVVWLDLGTPAPEYVVRVAWLPGDRAVLVLTLDRAQQRLRLHACDPADGRGRVVLEEADPAWIEPPPAPRVHAGRWLLRRSEPDTHAWFAHEIGGPPGEVTLGPAQRLTPPGYDAEELLALDMGAEGPARVVFTGAALGSGRRLVYEVRAGAPRPLFDAGAAGSVEAQLDAAGAHALVRRSAQTVPPRLELWSVAPERRLALLGDASGAEVSALALAVPEVGEVPVADPAGTRIRYRLWHPPDFDPARRYGLLVHVYGGPGSRLVRDAWGRGPLLTTLFCQHGLCVLEVDGRGSAGQGRAFARAVRGRLGVHELEDHVAVLRALGNRPYLDAGRVGIWGWSYGGFLATLALLRHPDVFRAGVAVAPVTDWRLYDTIYTERYMGLPAENAAGYAETSCLARAGALRGPLLLLHGLADDNVHPLHTLRLVDAWIEARVTCYEALCYPGRGHALSGASYDVFARLFEHLVGHLAPAAPPAR